MIRRLALVLLAAVLLSLTGCGKRTSGDPNPSPSPTRQHTQTCSTPGPTDGPSPTWSFRCEVKP
ncbi:MAG TPA: hypothetical protein VIP77_16025 [Jiangellaceae bacterium]